MNAPVDLQSSRFDDDTHGYIAELRSVGPHAPTADGHVFFNQREATQIMRCVDFRFAFPKIDPSSSPYLARAIEHELLNMHGEPHARIRTLVSAALRERVVDDLRTRISAVADDLIDAMPERGVVDLTVDFADPLPARILGPMYDIPYDSVDGLNEWIHIGGRKLDALQSGEDIGEVEAANRNLHDFIRNLLGPRRRSPGDDILSELILAEVDGDRFTDDELVYLAAELAAAGVDTTRAQLPLILLALFDHPHQLAMLQADPDDHTMAAVDEGMRFAPLPWALPHAAIDDIDLGGASLAAGELAWVLVPAVNRDPAAMERPDEFDLARPRVRNFSFGHGMHACPAAQLARIEMAIALEQLITRTRSLRLVERPELEGVGKGRTPTSLLVEIERT